MGRLRQFIIEYIGNLNHPETESADPAPPPAAPDRRRNRYARELIDWIEKQMEAREFPSAKKIELIKDLRRAYRQGPPARTDLSANDASEVGAPEWAAGAKGVSRDAPS
jgi:hypothetical protein